MCDESLETWVCERCCDDDRPTLRIGCAAAHGDLATEPLGIAGWCAAEREDTDDEVLAMAMMCS